MRLVKKEILLYIYASCFSYVFLTKILHHHHPVVVSQTKPRVIISSFFLLSQLHGKTTILLLI